MDPIASAILIQEFNTMTETENANTCIQYERGDNEQEPVRKNHPDNQNLPRLNNENQLSDLSEKLLSLYKQGQLQLSELLFPLFVSPHITHEQFSLLRELWFSFNRIPYSFLFTGEEFFHKLEALSRAQTEEGWLYVRGIVNEASLIINAQSPRYSDGVPASNHSNLPSPAVTPGPEYSSPDSHQNTIKLPSQAKKLSHQPRATCSGATARKCTRQQPYNGGGFIVIRPTTAPRELKQYMNVWSVQDLPDTSDPDIFRTTGSQNDFPYHVYAPPQTPQAPIIPSQSICPLYDCEQNDGGLH
ncbi:8645_t:CDS:1 [Paraglomus brasilianum]|uniref:8645_t:CDS:1 n=1 Tax=Paraglomus brasilianum TaxID=144538 RepID=A0A9N8ZHA2_9GLOM|nr:8645_t:CDS:1 [Paraglomus brasilianum]